MTRPGEPAPTFFGVYGEWMQTAMPTWSDVGLAPRSSGTARSW
ncbi:MAG: hypothetical protein WKF47_05060 [Geodermatophilaceae bacterium]